MKKFLSCYYHLLKNVFLSIMFFTMTVCLLTPAFIIYTPETRPLEFVLCIMAIICFAIWIFAVMNIFEEIDKIIKKYLNIEKQEE